MVEIRFCRYSPGRMRLMSRDLKGEGGNPPSVRLVYERGTNLAMIDKSAS